MRVAVYPHPCWVWGGTSSAVEGRRAGSLWSRRQQVRPSASVWSSPKCDQSGGRAGSRGEGRVRSCLLPSELRCPKPQPTATIPCAMFLIAACAVHISARACFFHEFCGYSLVCICPYPARQRWCKRPQMLLSLAVQPFHSSASQIPLPDLQRCSLSRLGRKPPHGL